MEKLLKDAQEAVGLRADEPSGRIQIRIGSSPPIVGQFNHAHTVQDIRNFIVT